MLRWEDMMDSPTVNSVSETRLLTVMLGHCTIGAEPQGRARENVRGVLSGCSGGQLSRDSAKGIAGGGGEGISMPCKDEEP